jgi:transcriptional regulator with XRE-family HTH domain
VKVIVPMQCPHCKGTGSIECTSISEVMAARRAELGLSLRSVENQATVSASTISRLESGKAADWDTMVKLARFYEVSLDAIAGMPVFMERVEEATDEAQ